MGPDRVRTEHEPCGRHQPVQRPAPTKRVVSYSLYRLFDSAGVLLYVGMTSQLKQRLMEHRGKSWWRSVDVSQTRVETFQDSVACSLAEQAAISTERPRFNRAGLTSPYIPYGAPIRSVGAPELDALESIQQEIADAPAIRAALIRDARAEGATWRQIADVLEMKSIHGARKAAGYPSNRELPAES